MDPTAPALNRTEPEPLLLLPLGQRQTELERQSQSRSQPGHQDPPDVPPVLSPRVPSAQ